VDALNNLRAVRPEAGAPLAVVPPRNTQAGTVSGGVMLLIGAAMTICALAGAALAPGCTAARQRGTVAVGAFLDCEAPGIASVLPDLLPLAKDGVMLAISGDGHVDTARIKADAAPIKSDLGRCVFAAAVAALATPVPTTPGAPAAAELAIDGAALRGAFTIARGELGWAPVRVAGEVL
jgi:hypothetical protein